MFFKNWENSLTKEQTSKLNTFTSTSDSRMSPECLAFIEETIQEFNAKQQVAPASNMDEGTDNTSIPSPIVIWRMAHLKAHLSELPYPLSRKAIDFIQQRLRMGEDEEFPQFPYLLTATVSLMNRQWGICSIQSYLQAFQGKDPTMNKFIVQYLRQPSDNQWWRLVDRLIAWMMEKKNKKTLLAHEVSHFVKAMSQVIATPLNLCDLERPHQTSYTCKRQLSSLKNVGHGIKYLLDFRNALIHAEKISDTDIAKASLVLESILEASLHLNTFHLATKVNNKEYILQGLFPELIESPTWKDTLENKELILLMKKDTYLCSISPLMSLAQDIDILNEEQEIFFINAGSLNLLKYVGFVNGEHKDGKSLGAYEQFKTYIAGIPVPQGTTDRPLIDFSDFIEDKTKNFVGRTDVLAEIEHCVSTRGGQYCFLQALAGMGKSAIMSRLFQLHPFRNDDGKRIKEGDIWLYHYCMQNDGRDQALTALRSLITQIQFVTTGQEGKRPSMKVDDLKEEFQRLLNTCQKDLERRGGNKVVVVIDALDEASFIDDNSIPGCLPDYIADHVVFICSYRVDATCTNKRVQNHLQHLPSEKIHILESAKPLRGLNKDNVLTFLDVLSDEPTPEVTVEHVWEASSQDLEDAADPFYLRFVADGVEKNQYFLKHPETIPTSLNGAFEKMWLSLPSDRNFLAHRLLVTLGIMRDMGDDELFAELFGRQFPNETFSVDDIAAVRRPIGKLLSYDGDRYGLFHDRFKYFLVGEQPDPIEQALMRASNDGESD